jgi:hypothetical protein
LIILNNYSKIGTYIVLEANSHSIVEKDKVQFVRQGVGGFSEDGELLGIYVDNNKFFFLYNDKEYEIKPDEIFCTIKKYSNGICNFKVDIKDNTVCNISYKPYISPLALSLGDDENEFDFLFYLSKLLHDRNSIEKFIEGMNYLKSCN